MTRACALVAILAAVALSVAAGQKVRKVTPEEVAAWQRDGKTVVFLDTRNGTYESRIPGSVHVPPKRAEEWAASADKEALVVAYCT